MRFKVGTGEVYHLWAHQSQSHASSGPRSFEGKSAYSYQALIGLIVENEAGERAYLVSRHSYSVTTTGHQTDLCGAIPPDALVFRLDGGLRKSPDLILRGLLDEIPGLKQQADRARANKLWRIQGLVSHVEQTKRFALFFGIANDAVEALSTDDLEAASLIAQTEHAAQIEVQRVRDQAAQEERERVAQERLVEWLAGSAVRIPWWIRECHLRVQGTTVETSHGAVVPIKDVRRAAPLILGLIDRAISGQERVEVKGVKFGPYAIDRIEPDGTVVVGCHRFAAAEIERFAGVLARSPEKIAA